VELYARVRRAVHVEGRSQREVAREFGLARKTVRKMLAYPAPPGYQRQKPVLRPKLGPWQDAIDAILEQDKSRSRRQRHTAKRIFERLREEHGYTGGYTIVKDYVRQLKISAREMFVPLSHAPGEAQADFGEALVVVAGVECEAHYLVFDLPHSDDCFVVAFPAETTEAFLEGHVRAFAYFGGVPTRILYDNTTLAVARILGDGERQKTGPSPSCRVIPCSRRSSAARPRQRQGQGGRPGGLCAAQLHGSDSTRIELGRAEPASGSCLPEATAAPVARTQGDHRGTLRARPRSAAALAGCAL
jgi:transposase